MDSGTFSKSAGAVSGTAREAGAAPRLDADRIAALAIVIGLFYGRVFWFTGKWEVFWRMHRKYIRV